MRDPRFHWQAGSSFPCHSFFDVELFDDMDEEAIEEGPAQNFSRCDVTGFSTNQRPRNYLRQTENRESTYWQVLLYEQRLQKNIKTLEIWQSIRYLEAKSETHNIKSLR